uniref:Mucin-5AC-like n=1 Tax=Diabrotica virgifera virgifera TaxID=50390 RepID=A0A6P7FV82_DIAVI
MLLPMFLLLLVIWPLMVSSENCEKIDWLQPFNNESSYTCNSNGWFADQTDKECRQYFVCITNGESYIKIYLKCPTGSYFDNTINDCSAEYLCPYQTIPTTNKPSTEQIKTTSTYNIEDTSTQTHRITTYETNLTTRESETLSTENTPTTSGNNIASSTEREITDSTKNLSTSESDTTISTTPEISTTQQQQTTPIDECSYNDNPDYFTCTVKGRFRNANDRTCRTYYLCNVLSSRRVIQTKYTCPSNSNFNPVKQLCDVDYSCPCPSAPDTTTTSSPTVTTNNNITTEVSTEELIPTTAVTTEGSSNQNVTDSSTSNNETTENVKTTSDNDVSTNTEPELTTSSIVSTTDSSISESDTTISTTPEVTTTERQQTTPIDECSYNDNPDYFTCRVKGRFRNANDRTCKTYYFCNVLSSGRVIQTKYTCPSNSNFNPVKQLCDVDYSCPCPSAPDITTISSLTITTNNNIPTEASTEEITFTTAVTTDRNNNQNVTDSSTSNTETTESVTNISDNLISSNTEPELTTSSIISTTDSSTSESDTTISTTPEVTTTEQQQTTLIDECSYNGNPDYFTCTVKGRFRNANDRTCKTYYLCNVLSSGRVIQTKYTCPSNSNFNPVKELCDIDYSCPCPSAPDTTTTPSPTVTANNNITTEVSTEEKTPTTEVTTEGSSNQNFTDSSTSKNETTENVTTTSDKDVSTNTEPELTTSSIISTTDSSTSESDTTILTTPEVTTTERQQTTPIDECSYNGNPDYFTCTIKGRFRNANDRTCKTYYLCNVLSSGRVIQTKFTCLSNSNFNPVKQLCDVEYSCPCSLAPDTTTTSSSTVTTNNNITTKASTEEIKSTTPVTTERNTNQNVTDSSTSNNETTENVTTTSDSDESTNTEPELTTSSIVSTTNSSTSESDTTLSTTPEVTTTEQQQTASIDECSYNDNPDYFTCTVKGRFRNANDKTCRTYYLCNVLSSGRVIQTKYTCPSNSNFNPAKQLCDVDYSCRCPSAPDTTTTSSSTVTTNNNITTEASTEEIKSTTAVTTERNTNQNVTDSIISNNETTENVTTTSDSDESTNTEPELTTSSIVSTTDSSTSESGKTISTTPEVTTTEQQQTTSIDECSYNDNPDYFTCTVKGRFRNANDRTCRTYYLCNVLSSGRVIQTKYICPSNSNFNPAKQLCDVDYSCRCPSAPDTTTTSSSTVTTNNNITTKASTEEIKSTTPVTTERNTNQNVTDSSTSNNETTENVTTTSDNDVSTNTEPELTTSSIVSTTNSSTSESDTTLSTTPEVTTTEQQQTASIDECSYNDNPDYFTCTVKGRFRNANDKTCRTYYLCNVLSSGRVIQTKYTCPSNSNFNPAKQLCDVDYSCPCPSAPDTTTTSSSTVTTNNNITTKASTEEIKSTTPVTTERNTNQNVTDSSTSNNETTENVTTTSDSDVSTNTEPELTTSSIVSTTDSSSSVSDTTISTTPEVTTTEQQQTASIDECSYNDNPDYFTCTVKGRFRNANDKTCRTYYLCNVLSSGRVIQTKYTCPSNSNFNPAKQLCDVDYTCPCPLAPDTTTTSSHTVTTNNNITNEVSTEDEVIYTTAESTERNTNQNVTDSSTSNTETTVNETTTSDNNVSTNTKPELTTSSIMSTTDSLSSESDPTKSTTPEVSTTEQQQTTPIDECSYNDNPDYFSCTVKGRFRNANDRTCRTYYLCNVLSSGRVIQTKYSCPSNSNFDPAKQLCDVDYSCPCPSAADTTITSSSTVTPNNNITTEVSTEEDILSTTAVTTERNNNQNITDGITSNTEITENVTTISDSDVSTNTEAELITSSIISTTDSSTSESDTTVSTAAAITTTEQQQTTPIDECSYNDNPDYFTCTMKGRFRNANDGTCRTYYLCNVLSSGRVIQTKYTCPSNSNFNPAKQLCDVDYSCPCPSAPDSATTSFPTVTTNNNITTEISREDEIISTTVVTTERNNNQNVTESSISNTNSTENVPTTSDNDVSTNTKPELTTSSIISTTDSSTSESYTNVSTTATITTTEQQQTAHIDECSYNDNPDYFNCTVKGRFRNANDRTCGTYYLCNVLSSGKVIQTKYTCPSNSNFNPAKQLCDVDYRCPCPSAPDTTTTASTSTVQEISTLLPTDKVTTEGIGLNSSTTETVQIDVCIYEEDPDYFTCTTSGNFPNLNDISCKTYFFCINIVDPILLIKSQYTCEKDTYFNPLTKTCEAEYVCPCIGRTSSSINNIIQTTSTSSTESVDTSPKTDGSTSQDVSSSTASTTLDSNTTSSRSVTITGNSDSTTRDTESTTTSSNPGTSTPGQQETTPIDECSHNDDPNYFICTEKGRFRNANDRTCETYYLCNVLRSGRIIQTKYNCPSGSNFNPIKQLCDVDYKCPCVSVINTTTTIN